MPTIQKLRNVTLKKGYVKCNPEIWAWFNKIKESQISKGTMDICLLDDAGKTTIQWTLRNARIVKIDVTDLKNDGNVVAIEFIEVAFQDFIVK